MIRNLTNISDADVYLADFNGLTIAPGETVAATMFADKVLRDSVDVIRAVIDNVLKINDGTSDYVGNAAINLIKGVPEQLTDDGKPLVTSSDRPANTYRYYTGFGDNIENQTRGDGDSLVFDVPAGETMVKDVFFIDDIYLKDGVVVYQNAELGSYLSVDIMVPANSPYPAISKDGNFDLVGGQLVPNTDNTGAYQIRETESVFNRFVNRMLLLGSLRDAVLAPEPTLMPRPIFQRFTIHNASPTNNLKAVVAMGLYRLKTV